MTDKTEPPGSASSSPDKKCTCGCTRAAHMGKPRGCLRHGFHAFAPADAETAGESEHQHDWCDWGAVYHGGYCQWRDCQSCGATESRNEWPFGPDTDPEPEAPEELPQMRLAELGERVLAEHVQMRRPPYAVAYETEGGAQYEIALPGDATIRAVDGALIITHASAVKALTQARPMEGA